MRFNILSFGFLLIGSAQAQKVPLVTNQTGDAVVKTIAIDSLNRKAYIGGSFSMIGSRQPWSAFADKATNQLKFDLATPNGVVLASFSDGNGGYYIGGNFAQIGNDQRNYLAQYDGNGQLTQWAKDLKINGPIKSILKNSNKVFVSGDFSGVAVNKRALTYNINTVESISGFPEFNGSVDKVISDNNGGWYVAGSFTEVGGVPRKGLAHITALNSVDDFFKDQTFNGLVKDMALYNNNLYLGGELGRFNGKATSGAALDVNGNVITTFPGIEGPISDAQPDGNGGWVILGSSLVIGGVYRNNIAHLSANGTLLPLNPVIDNNVSSILVSNGTVYLAGNFSQVNGQDRLGLAAIDLATGALLSWAPTISNFSPQMITLYNSLLVVGGGYEDSELGWQNRIYTVNLTTNEIEQIGLGIDLGGQIQTLEAASNTLYVGGRFIISSLNIQNLGAFDLANKTWLSWNPQPDGAVEKIEVVDNTVYFSGDFRAVGGIERENAAAVDAQTALVKNWNPQPNGTIVTILADGTNLFLGGGFTEISGINSPYFAKVNAITGQLINATPIAPNSWVYALAKSGDKIFVGGSFGLIGGTIRKNLAVVDKNTGFLDGFSPDFDNHILDLDISNNVLYASGGFTQVGAVVRNRLVSFDLINHQLTTWDPSANDVVNAIEVDGSVAYVGGYFSEVGGSDRSYLAAIDVTSGLATAWTPAPNNAVTGIVKHNGIFYVNGYFYEVDGATRYRLAGINVDGSLTPFAPITLNYPSNVTPAPNALYVSVGNSISSIDYNTGAITDWDLRADNGITTIALQNDKMFVGGYFSSISACFKRLLVLDAATGVETFLNVKVNGEVNTFAQSGNTVFIGGNFTSVNGAQRNNLAAIDANTGNVSAWAPNPDGAVTCLAMANSAVYAAGYFQTMGGQSRYKIGAVDIVTGNATPWNVTIDEVANAITAIGGKIYIGGNFNAVNFEERPYLAEVDGISGELTGWNPSPSAPVTLLQADGATLYVAGNFHSISQTPRSYAASYNTVTSDLSNWSAGVDGAISTLSFSGNSIFAGGSFNGYNLQTVYNAAAVDVDNGNLLPWTPNVNGEIEKIIVYSGKVYLGGTFSTVDGQTRNNIASVDALSGLVSSWNPNCNGTVWDMVPFGNLLFIGGWFSNVGGQSRGNIASLDISTGQATTWNPSADNLVSSIFIQGNTAFVGGKFRNIAGQDRKTLANLDLTTGVAGSWNPYQSFGIPSNTISRSIIVSGDSFWLSNQYGFALGSVSANSLSKIKFLPNVTDLRRVPGFLWVATEGGLQLYDNEELHSQWNSPIYGSVYDIASNNNKIWAVGNFTAESEHGVKNLAVITTPFQSITFSPIPEKVVTDAPFSIGATSSSGTLVTFTSSNELVATISGNVVTITGPGTTQITAYAEGSNGIYPASKSQTLIVRSAEPTVQSSLLTASSITQTSLTLSWTNGNGDRRIVVVKNGVQVDTPPADGAVYNANSSFSQGQEIGAGNFVVYNGAGNSVAVTGLVPGETYAVKVYESVGNDILTNYNNTGSAILQTITIPANPIANEANNVNSGIFRARWNPVIGASGYELEVSLNSTFTQLLNGFNPKQTGNTDFLLSGLNLAEKQYWYRVKAINTSGKSDYSNIIQVVTPPAPLTLVVNNHTVTTGGYKLSATITGGSGPREVDLSIKGIADSDFVSASTTNLEDNYEAIIPESDFDELGLEYFFKVTDATGTVEQPNHSFIYKTILSSSNVHIPFDPGFNGKQKTYQMFSVPFVLQENDIEKIFDRPLNGQDKTEWRLYHYDNVDKVNYEYPEQVKELKIGEGYWFNTIKKDFSITLGDAEVARVSQSAPFKLNLKPGWNQIGNPYPFDIDWNKVRLGLNEVGPLNFWLNGGYDDTKSMFRSWDGAFVHYDGPSQLELAIPLNAKTNGRIYSEETIPAYPDEDAWSVALRLEAGDLYQTVGVGMHNDARITKDQFDRVTLPRFGNFAEMSVLHPEFFSPNFSTDIVPSGDEYVWTFNISTNLSDKNAKLFWDNTTLKSAHATLFLLDFENGAWIDMKAHDRYSFSLHDGAIIKVMYSRWGDPNPTVNWLGDAFPNPFERNVTIPLLTDGKDKITYVEVYDILGRRIRLLSTLTDAPGQHFIVWDGTDNQGAQVQPGTLLYRLVHRGGPVKRFIKLN